MSTSHTEPLHHHSDTDPPKSGNAWIGVADEITAGLSEDFFENLLCGAQLGGRAIDDVRIGVLTQVRAALGGSTEPARPPLVTLHPIVHLESDAIIGYEAAVTFSDEASDFASKHEYVPPRTPSREVEAVRVALDSLPEISRGQFLAVNVSTGGLAHDQLIPTLLDSDVDRLVVEISEGVAADIVAVRQGIDALAHLGVRSAIDGAGKGLFRGASLYEVSPALLKIDPAIIQGCTDDDEQRILLEKLIAFGRRLGALVVVTGVDSRDALAAAVLLGIDAAQGTLVQPTQALTIETTDRSSEQIDHSSPDLVGRADDVDPVLEAIAAMEASETRTAENVFSFTPSV